MLLFTFMLDDEQALKRQRMDKKFSFPSWIYQKKNAFWGGVKGGTIPPSIVYILETIWFSDLVF